jgi:hypothetical protein
MRMLYLINAFVHDDHLSESLIKARIIVLIASSNARNRILSILLSWFYSVAFNRVYDITPFKNFECSDNIFIIWQNKYTPLDLRILIHPV